MELKFLGIGSAFATKLYNTSAYFVEDNKLFLIDCGETTFEQLICQDFFKEIEQIFVAFTHTHSDHIAGIGSLVNFCSTRGKKLNIIVPSMWNNGLYDDILILLEIFSIPVEKVSFIPSYSASNYFSSYNSIHFLNTYHAPELKDKCYSILFKTSSGNILYSGDSNNIKYISKYLNENLDKMYVDVTLTIPTVHLDLNILDCIVPENMRSKVYCMHFDSQECMLKAMKLGFKIAPSVAKNLKDLAFYFKYKKYADTLLLNRCNEIVFMQLQQYSLLEGINQIFVQVYDTNHSNISGIGSLLCYSFFVLNKSINVHAKNNKVKSNLLRLCQIYGIPERSINFVGINEIKRLKINRA